MRMLFSGSIAYDYLMTFPGDFTDHLHADQLDNLSVSFLVDSLVRYRGGVAANIAYGYQLLGGQAQLIGATGKEDFSGYRQWLEEQNINLTTVKEVSGEFSASFFANTDKKNRQFSSFFPGAMQHGKEVRLATTTQPDLLVISADDYQTMLERVREAQALNWPYCYDPGQQVVRLSAEELKEGLTNAQMFMANEYEWTIIQEKTGLSVKAVTDLVPFVGITLAEKGSTFYYEGTSTTIPIVPPVSLEDPTGAGDAFRGGLLRGYSLGLSWDLAGRMGAVAATYCLEHKGTQNHQYTPTEFVTRFRRHFDDQGKLDILMNDTNPIKERHER